MMKPSDYPMDAYLAAVKQAVYDAVEIWNRGPDFKELLGALAAHNLQLVNMVGHEHVSQRDGKHAEGFSRRRNHSRLEAELAESIDIAVEYGVPDLIAFTGHKNLGESSWESLVICAEGLKRVVPYAERSGVNVNIEIFNTRIDHPGYLCDHVDQAVALCEMVNSPRLGILFDIYHVQVMEGDVIRSLTKHAKWIKHYHTGGCPGRHELDDTQELNYRGICRAIADTDFDGYVGHEFVPAGDPIDAIKDAFHTCNLEEPHG